jgi:hypothetical protein
MVDEQDLEAALARLSGAEQAGGTGADHDNVKILNQKWLQRLPDKRKQLSNQK